MFFRKEEETERLENGVRYRVDVYDIFDNPQIGRSLTFYTREDARQYKRAIRNSLSELSADIVRIEFSDGFMLDEKAIW